MFVFHGYLYINLQKISLLLFCKCYWLIVAAAAVVIVLLLLWYLLLKSGYMINSFLKVISL